MKFVIFDIDGTLTNTKRVDDKCFIKAFEQTFGLDIQNQKWEDIRHVTDWGITEEIIQNRWNRNPTKEEYAALVANHIGNLTAEKRQDKSQFAEVSGAQAFFDNLRNMEGIKLGIATGAWEKSAQLKLETAGIKLNGICFSNSDYHKSREAITKDVIDQLTKKNNGNPERIVYFGDGEWDYKTCKNLGIDFFGIDHENDSKLRKLGAKTVFQDYTDAEQIMNVLKSAGRNG